MTWTEDIIPGNPEFWLIHPQKEFSKLNVTGKAIASESKTSFNYNRVQHS